MESGADRPLWADELGRMAPFARLPPVVQELLSHAFTECSFDTGEALVRQGEPGDCLLVLLDGQATGTVDVEGEAPRHVGRFACGDVVGEMALITQEPRTATVNADTPVHALRLGADAFRDVAVQHPEVAVVLTHLIADRLGERSVDGLGGKHFDRYVVLRALARGGMSVVYEAEDTEGEGPVALKMMSHRLIYEPGASWRFHREAELLLTLDHPNVVRMFRRFEAFKTQFIAMEYCDGPDLSDVLGRHGALPEEDARAMLGQIAAALVYLHGHSVIHRDLKPDNVMCTSSGMLKLLDFGLAKPVAFRSGMASTEERTILGTPIYMAPEQITCSEIGPEADFYALGCIGVELLTGKPLFQSETLSGLIQEKLVYEMSDKRGLREDLSDDIYESLCQCLAREPRERAPDLAQMASWAAPLRQELCAIHEA